MPEREFPVPRVTAFLKLVLVPLGLWSECWRRKAGLVKGDRRYAVRPLNDREAWLKLMTEPSTRHGDPWGRIVVNELKNTGLRCLAEPNDDLFAYSKKGTPWRSKTGKERVHLGLLAARELGLDVSPWTDKGNDEVQILKSRNWALSNVGKTLVKQARKIERRRKVANPKAMSPRDVVDWVMENLDNETLGVASYPNGACRSMMFVARENKEKFVTEYMRLAYKVEKPVGDTPKDEPEGEAKSLDDLLGAAVT